jgi:hypothetical protein
MRTVEGLFDQGVEITEPLVAFKAARVVDLGGGKFAFEALRLGKASSHNTNYRVDDRAVCDLGGEDHQAPKTECGCGFWGVYERDDILECTRALLDDECALLEVDVSGRCELHELGVRAEHQVVLSVTFGDTCSMCGKRPSTQLAFGNRSRVYCICAECSPLAKDDLLISTSELAGALETEVRFGALPWAEMLRPWRSWKSRIERFLPFTLVGVGLVATLITSVVHI